jgi:hypothetical protein
MKVKPNVYLFCLVLLVMVTACFTSLYAAGNSTEGASFSWSPYTWSFYETYSTSSMTFKATGIRFTDSYLRTFPVPFLAEYAPTFDFTYAADDGKAYTYSSSYWATNLKSPAHDLDDDNGNGYYEEAEVTGTGYENAHIDPFWGTIYAIDYIDTSKSYYYYQTFNKSSTIGTHSGYMYFNMQRSIWLFEWQAMDYDLLEKEYFSYSVSGGGGGGGGGIVDEIDMGPGNLSKISFASIDKGRVSELLSSQVYSTKSLDNRMILAEKAAETQKIKIPWFTPDPANHRNSVDNLMAELNNTRRHVERISNDLNIEYVYGGITFDQPLQIEDLYLFLSQNDIRIDRFEGYALDDNEIASFGGSALDGEAVDMKRVESLVPANAEIKGIYAIWGWLPAGKLELIETSRQVLALDVRAFEIHFLAWLQYDLTEVPTIDYEFDDLYWAIKQWNFDRSDLQPKTSESMNQ